MLWLVIFFLVPVVLIALYSVNVFSLFPGGQDFTLDAWKNFLDGSPFLDLFWKSVRMSLIVSVVAVLARVPDRVLPRARRSRSGSTCSSCSS